MNLGIMHDALEEQRELSPELQRERVLQLQGLVGQSVGRLQRP